MPDFEDGLRTGTTVEVITDSHSIRTNPEVSVRLMARCGRFTAVRRGHKTQSLQLLDQFLSKNCFCFLSRLTINLMNPKILVVLLDSCTCQIQNYSEGFRV